MGGVTASYISMLTRLLHRLVAIPFFYDLAQFAAGAPVCIKFLKPIFASLVREGCKVIDVGGGTGMNLTYFNVACDYTCLDNDPQKLEGFKAKHPNLKAILGDATALPFENASFDVGLMSAVSHHLTDDVLRQAFAEISRVLKPSGVFIFMDALWEPRVFRSRALWRVDRGACPRAYSDLRAEAEVLFHLQEEVRWAVHHRYVCWILKPKFG